MNETIKRVCRSKTLRPVLNHIYRDSDNRKFEKGYQCIDSGIIKRHIDKKNHRKEDTNKYYFS